MLKTSLAALTLGVAAAASAVAAPAQPKAYGDIVQSFIAAEFRAHPSEATASGLHDYDGRLDDASLAAHKADQKRLHATLQALQAVNLALLSPAERDEREVLIGEIKGEILDEETIQAWRKNPDLYTQLATGAVFALIERDFAPLAERMKNATLRERQIPAMLATAKSLLADEPRAYVEIAVQNVDGAIGFFKDATVEAFAPVKDPGLQKSFTAANAAAVKAFEDYRDFLKTLLPKAAGSFAWGADALAQHLADDDMIDLPLDTLLRHAEDQLHKDQKGLAEAAAKIAPGQPVEAVVPMVRSIHPTADKLVSTAASFLAGLRGFVVSHRILTIPSDLEPEVGATPAFARDLISAEMDPPGPLEQHATTAYYFVTPPDPKLSPKELEEYLRSYNNYDFEVTSSHEVWPGHFMQFLAQKAHPEWSELRKLSQAQSTTEGWAHYVEQMMLDEGLGNGDPKLRFGQLLEALLRDCRAIVAIEMHAHGMTVDAAIDLFMHEGHVPRPEATREAYRGTSDPGFLTYTMGKLEILKLREDYRQKIGKAFTLADFHDRFLAAGLLPVKIIRREMMGADAPVL